MPLPADTSYPAIATNEAWQKKKSLIDKTGKTNVGPQLVTAKTKWAAIKFADLDSSKSSKTVAGAQANLTKAKAAWTQVVAARTALKAAWTVVDTQAANNKLAGASKAALVEISKALKAADTRLKNMDDIVGAFQIDLNNATKTAMANWTNLEIKAGSKILAHAKSAKLQTDGSYDVTGVDWTVPDKMTLDYLQKAVKVSAHDGTGQLHNQDMTIKSITGSGQMRLK
jgi:hypothetical protein